ncbi:MAG: DUF6624 domain-containing protein [Gemmatimonadaceae bacterium]
MKSVVLACAIVCCIASSAAAQPRAAVDLRAQAAIDALSRAVKAHDAAGIEAAFHDSFHLGVLGPPSARHMVAVGMGNANTQVTGIVLDSTTASDSGTVAYTRFMLPTGSSPNRMLLASDYRITTFQAQVSASLPVGTPLPAGATAVGPRVEGVSVPAASSSIISAHPPRDSALRAELVARADTDQTARRKFKGASVVTTTDFSVTRIDAANTARMKEIIHQHGWPGRDLVGDDGSNSAWLLVQHADADPAFQETALEAMRKALDAGQVRPSLYAYLLDRVRVGQKKPQRYGTQVQWIDGVPTPFEIEDGADVDARRTKAGLEPLADYLKRMRDMQVPAKPDLT